VTVSRHYHFEFDHPVAKLWSVVSDTPRWGEASGFPRYQASESLQPDGRVRVFGKLEIAGMTLAWEEPPVNWIAERWFEQRRIFSRGPIDSMTTRATPQPGRHAYRPSPGGIIREQDSGTAGNRGSVDQGGTAGSVRIELPAIPGNAGAGGKSYGEH
jgi:hypothetical protein